MSSTEQSAPFAPSEVYDYIIVGGGTAGPAVARRLAEGHPTTSVLLLEAGSSNEGLNNSQMLMGWSNFLGTVHDWGYATIPQKHANNRIIDTPRAKFLGGCSGMNGSAVLRGGKADYDKWAEMGCKGWGWEDVLPYFKKSETFHPNSDKSASPYHGTSGPVHTTFHPLAPISSYLIESFRDKGFAYKPDMFVEGEGEGVGHTARTVHKGIRTSGADYVTADVPPNLTVRTCSQVLRIILSQGSPQDRRAIAVEVEDQSYKFSSAIVGTRPLKYVIEARREIIISAGAYNSPTLLMHSGIGPRAHLEEVHVVCHVDLKGVGENLQDHLLVLNFYKLNKPQLTYDHLIYMPGAAELAVKEWTETKTGVMSRFPFGPYALKARLSVTTSPIHLVMLTGAALHQQRMDALMKDSPEWKRAQAITGLEDPTGQGPTQPHVEYFSTEMYGGGKGKYFEDFPSHPSHSVFAMITLLCGPQARGTVRLPPSTACSTPDPHARPVIDHAYLSSPLDVAVLAEGCRLGHEIVVEGKGTKEHIAGAWPQGRVQPHDIEEWKEFVKDRAGTCYHPAGTCKMGPDGDEWAVVDDRLRVKSVLGLRVADCSIMPWLNNGHTQAVAYMIGEKCAALILEDHDVTQQLGRVDSDAKINSSIAPNQG